MPANGPGEVIGELVPLLGALNVGVRLATEVSEASYIDRRIGAAGKRGVVEVRQTAARVLEAKLVDFVGAERPAVLHCARHISIGLLRCTRVSILAKWL